MATLNENLVKIVSTVMAGDIKTSDFYNIDIGNHEVKFQGDYTKEKLTYYRKLGYELKFDFQVKMYRGKAYNGVRIVLTR